MGVCPSVTACNILLKEFNRSILVGVGAIVRLFVTIVYSLTGSVELVVYSTLFRGSMI